METREPRGDVIARGRLVLSGLLLVWHPALAALRTSNDFLALSVRGAPLAVGIVVRLLVVAVGFAAGKALLGRQPGADRFAQVALVMSAVMDLVVYTTYIFPSNRMPGDTPFYVAASLAYHSAWVIYLERSRRRESP